MRKTAFYVEMGLSRNDIPYYPPTGECTSLTAARNWAQAARLTWEADGWHVDYVSLKDASGLILETGGEAAGRYSPAELTTAPDAV